MTAAEPKYTHGEVDRAGDILISDSTGIEDERQSALEVLDYWRAAHNYPMNTFQATLRYRLTVIHREALVAQRLKRTPAILEKLRRFPTMHLSQIQDIGGLRAIVGNVGDVRALYEDYKDNGRLRHELAWEKNYINIPKPDGYRGVHLVYRYVNPKAPEYEGLLLEIQMRTNLQHAWATTVETMGTFLRYSLKSDEGPEKWRRFFALTGSAFAHLEGSPPVPGYESMSATDTFREVARQSQALKVKKTLTSLPVAMEPISHLKNKGSWFLIVLDPDGKRTTLQPFGKDRFAEATDTYLRLEESARGTQKQVVLVSTASVMQLIRAYPNFFLNTDLFLRILGDIERRAGTS